MTGASEYAALNRRRFDQARARHIDLVLRLADTEEQVALTLEAMATGDNSQRRTALADEARRQARRLRSYAERLVRR